MSNNAIQRKKLDSMLVGSPALWTAVSIAIGITLVLSSLKLVMPNGWPALVHPFSATGHGIAAGLLYVLFQMSKARAVADSELPSDTHAWEVSEPCTWVQTVQDLKAHELRYDYDELNTEVRSQRDAWCRTVGNQTSTLIFLAALPAVCGYIEGIHSIKFQYKGVLPEIGGILVPLHLGFAETVAVCFVAWRNRLGWEDLLQRWSDSAIAYLNSKRPRIETPDKEIVGQDLVGRPVDRNAEDAYCEVNDDAEAQNNGHPDDNVGAAVAQKPAGGFRFGDNEPVRANDD